MIVGTDKGCVLVVGAGTMGQGIAQTALVAGFYVYVADMAPTMLGKCRAGIAERLAQLSQKGKLSTEPDRVLERLTLGPLENIPPFFVVIEAVAENLASKASVFKKAYAISPQAVFASNTSSLSIETLAKDFPAPERFIGLHFFNPAPLMPLVEVVVTTKTDPDVAVWAKDFCQKMGKTPVVVTDAPGFIVNRVARPFYTETMRAVCAAHISTEDADAALQAQGFKMGPFKLMDLIGLDINYNVTTQVWEGLGRPARFIPPAMQAACIEKGYLGVKSGKGFYAYTNK